MKIRPIFLFLLLPGLLAAASDAFRLDVKDTGFGFDTAGIQFQGGPPAVELLAGEGPVSLRPSPEVTVSGQDCKTPMGPATARTWKWHDPRGFDFSWTVTRLAQWQGFTVKMTFANLSREPVKLRRFVLCQSDPEALQVTGDPAGWYLSTVDSWDRISQRFRKSGDMAIDARRDFVDTATLYSQHGSKGMVIGAVGPAVSDVRIACDVKAGRISLEIASDMSDVTVDPGETRESEEVLLLAAPCDTALTSLFRWMAVTHGARTKRGPIFGWCSWYSVTRNVNEAIVEDVLKTLIAKRGRLPMQVIQIDDGWQKAYGDWTPDPVKFPNGMKPIADKITAAGMIPGIWMCMVRSSKQGAHPDGKPDDYLDPTDPATQEFIVKSLKERYAEGYRYFKLDFNCPRWKNRHNQKLTRLQLQREMFKLYRQAIGEESYLTACVGGLDRGCIGYADGARIATDSAARWMPFYSGWCLPDCFNGVGSMALTNDILWSADPDVVYTLPAPKHLRKTGLPEGLRSLYGVAGLLGGFMMTSDLLHQKPWDSPEAIRLLEILNPPAPEKGRAFDGQTDPWHRQFGFVAKRPWGNFISVNLLNPSDEPQSLPVQGVPVEEIGNRFHVWSFWDNKYLGVADASFATAAIPGHASALLRLTALAKDPASPALVGSNLHVGMGSAEIQSVTATPGGIRVALTDAGAREGALFLHSPKPLSLVKAAGCNVKAVESAGENIWKARVENRRHGEPQSIELLTR